MGLSDRSTSGSRATIARIRSRATGATLGTPEHTDRSSPAVASANDLVVMVAQVARIEAVACDSAHEARGWNGICSRS